MFALNLRLTAKILHKAVLGVVLLAFMANSFNCLAYGQVINEPMAWMPKPGMRVHLSPEFTPSLLEGLVIHSDNALQFDFLIQRGGAHLTNEQKKEEYKKLVKYFLASLTVPEENQWVTY